MNSRRALSRLTVGALILTMSACSDAPSHGDTLPPTTTAVGDTVAESTTSSTSSTSSTSTTEASTTTSSTIPAVQGLGLTAQGLGDVLFGVDADQVITFVNSILGAPTTDSGWTDPLSAGTSCPGTTIRFVSWHDLSLFLTDRSPAVTGIKHFASYTYGPAFVPGRAVPFGLSTANGIGLGSTVKQLKAAYPAAKVNVGDQLSGPSFFIENGLTGFLTGTASTDTIISFVGGFGCGE